MADSYQIINSMADPHQKKKTGPSDENRIADSNEIITNLADTHPIKKHG